MTGYQWIFTDEQKGNFSYEFKLEPITTYHIQFGMKMLSI